MRPIMVNEVYLKSRIRTMGMKEGYVCECVCRGVYKRKTERMKGRNESAHSRYRRNPWMLKERTIEEAETENSECERAKCDFT